jgi:cytochrome c oxidase subunit IV
MNSSHHNSKAGLYRVVFIILLILTVLTVLIAQVNLGKFNLPVAIFVATIKASLVLFVFMHLKTEDWITWIYATVPIVLLAIMIIGVFIDNPFRKNLVHVKTWESVESNSK